MSPPTPVPHSPFSWQAEGPLPVLFPLPAWHAWLLAHCHLPCPLPERRLREDRMGAPTLHSGPGVGPDGGACPQGGSWLARPPDRGLGFGILVCSRGTSRGASVPIL